MLSCLGESFRHAGVIMVIVYWVWCRCIQKIVYSYGPHGGLGLTGALRAGQCPKWTAEKDPPRAWNTVIDFSAECLGKNEKMKKKKKQTMPSCLCWVLVCSCGWSWTMCTDGRMHTHVLKGSEVHLARGILGTLPGHTGGGGGLSFYLTQWWLWLFYIQSEWHLGCINRTLRQLT